MKNIEDKITNRLKLSPQEIVEICQKWGIVEMALFGSILREDFRENSDIDFIIKFDLKARQGLLTISKIKYELEKLVGRKVDLIIKESIENSQNWIRRQEILSTAKIIYEQSYI